MLPGALPEHTLMPESPRPHIGNQLNMVIGIQHIFLIRNFIGSSITTYLPIIIIVVLAFKQCLSMILLATQHNPVCLRPCLSLSWPTFL